MPTAKPHRIREMSEEEIRSRIEELHEGMYNLRFRNAMKRLDNPLEVRTLRREIAILETVLREHELGIRKLGAAGAKSEG